MVGDTGELTWDGGRARVVDTQKDQSGIFFHFVEARRRPPLRRDDFASWLVGWGDEYGPIRERLEAIDYTMWSLTELRERIAACFDEDRSGRAAR